MNLKDFFKRFKITNFKRAIALSFMLVVFICSVVFGSIFYISPKGRLGSEYAGGAEYVVSINMSKKSDKNELEDLSNDIALSIKERIDSLGVLGVTVDPEIDGDKANVRVLYPGITSESDKEEVEKKITSKPHLVLTDYYGNALFNSVGSFNGYLKGDPLGPAGGVRPEDVNWEKDSFVPIKNNGAEATYDTSYKVGVELRDTDASQEWTKATSYISQLPEGKKVVVAWLNLDEYIEEAKKKWKDEWDRANGNPYLFSFTGEKDKDEEGKPNSLKIHQIDAAKYLISNAQVTEALRGEKFVIEGPAFDASTTATLARQINYGVSKYSLETIFSSYSEPQYGKTSFTKVIIAGAIVFGLIAIFMIFNYGVMGVFASVSIALFTFLTMTIFIVLGGIFNASAVAALIIGIGMAVDSNIITFEKFKSNVYSGNDLNKASKSSNKNTISTIFDANITTFIVAVVLFYFGTKEILGLSLTLMISIILTLVVITGVTRIMTNLIISSNLFENKKGWLGIKPKLDQKFTEKINKGDYMKVSKYFMIFSLIIFLAGVIVYSIFAGINKSFGWGFNLSQSFGGGSILEFGPTDSDQVSMSSEQIANIKTLLLSNGIKESEIEMIRTSTDHSIVNMIKVSVRRDLPISNIRSLIDSSDITMYNSTTSTGVAKEMVNKALISIGVSIVAIVAYIIIRFKFTFAIAAIIALLHDAILVTAIFAITRVQVSPEFIAGVLSTIGYSINDTIVTFDRIREKLKNAKELKTEKEIKDLANEAIKDTLKRSIFTSLTTASSLIVLMSFGNATKLSFTLSLLVGSIFGTYSSIFIATKIWTKLEFSRRKRIEKKKISGYWNVNLIEEQTLNGINEFAV